MRQNTVLPRLCANCRHASTSPTIYDFVEEKEAFGNMDIENIRNFSVIAHIDHGKSTLADALLRWTGNISEKDRQRGQVLDSLQVERERGITVKAQTASMIFEDKRTNKKYLLNLIDTPGHIDFAYEVSRSLASCQGALLLVDSTQSIQAQTLANYGIASKLGLSIIPVVTKIDLPNAQPEDAALNVASTFGLDPEDVIMTSAKQQIGVVDVLNAVVDKLPSPKAFTEDRDGKFKGRIIDSWFDEHRGVICLVQVICGTLKEGARIAPMASVLEKGRSDYSVQDVGILTPTALRTGVIRAGHVGYVVAGLRSTKQARIGDTLYTPNEWTGANKEELVALPGYEDPKVMLFASIYPVDTTQLENLFAAVDRLCLNDSSISVTRDQSASLGAGLRCGFLGFLHMEVFHQRLRDEFEMDIIMTAPSVPYIIEYQNGTKEKISCVAEWPKSLNKKDHFIVHEPIAKVTLITPQDYFGAMTDLIKMRRGIDINVQHTDDGKVFITARIPWQEVVCDLSDQVKHFSAGYATFSYEESGYEKAELVKVEVAVNGEPCDALSFVCHRDNATTTGREMLIKLKGELSRQQFEIIIQAKIGAKILARERIAPYRKDVLTKGAKTVGGGDITRKMKLLKKQKEGKKRSKMVGKVEIGQEAFWAVLKR